MKIKTIINWKLFAVLLVAGIFATLAVIPFLLTIQGDTLKELPLSLPVIILLSVLQGTVLLCLAIFIGLFLGPRVSLGVPIVEKWIAKKPIKEDLKTNGLLGIKLGVLVGILIIIGDYALSFFLEPLLSPSAPLWQGLLASFYGGIVEEILLRLFLMTLIVWLISRIYKSKSEKLSSLVMWIAIITAAIIFGIGHLPATASITTLTPLIIMRAILLNGIGGIIFGWLYWKKGLETAIIAHFTADIVLLVIFPFLYL